MRFLSFLIACCALIVPCRGANAAIINGDFETGDLTGWQQSEPPPFVHSGAIPGGPTGYYTGVHTGLILGMFVSDSLQQTFSATQGQQLSFDYSWVLKVKPPSTSTATIRISGPNFTAEVTGSITVPPWNLLEEFPPPGKSESLPWTHWSGILPDTGEYTILVLADQTSLGPAGIGPGDIGYGTTSVYLDNVRLENVPEPCTAVLALVAGVLVAFRKRHSAFRTAARIGT